MKYLKSIEIKFYKNPFKIKARREKMIRCFSKTDLRPVEGYEDLVCINFGKWIFSVTLNWKWKYKL